MWLLSADADGGDGGGTVDVGTEMDEIRERRIKLCIRRKSYFFSTFDSMFIFFSEI